MMFSINQLLILWERELAIDQNHKQSPKYERLVLDLGEQGSGKYQVIVRFKDIDNLVIEVSILRANLGEVVFRSVEYWIVDFNHANTFLLDKDCDCHADDHDNWSIRLYKNDDEYLEIPQSTFHSIDPSR